VKKYKCFFGLIHWRILNKTIFNTLHQTIIYDERDIWINKMLILAIAFTNGNLMKSLFLL